MKRHYTSIRNLHLAILILLAFAACKKVLPPSTPVTPQPPIILPQTCKLVGETNNFPGNYQEYRYTYGKDGKLDSIYLATVPGAVAIDYCREDPDGFVWVSYSGGDGIHPNKSDYLYNSTLQDSSKFPLTLQTSTELWTGTRIENTPGYGYNFQYKANGKLDGFQQTAPFVTGLLLGLGVEYTPDGDIDNMTWNVTTGPRKSSTVKVSGYDGHPSPYTGIAGWVFLTPAVGWTSSEYDPLLYALSPHNPTGSVYDNGTDKWTEKITYEYNTKGLPTKRTVVRQTPTGYSFTYTHTYTYDCK